MNKKVSDKMISVVVPVYNEAKGIANFLNKELAPVLLGFDYAVEVVIVDDGSKDRTLDKIRECEILKKMPVRVVALTKNFGKEIALTAGLMAANGDAVIMVDADGQHPVEEIPRMISKWENGALIVTAVNSGNTTRHRVRSGIYYKMMRMMGNKNVVPGAMDFRLLDRTVVDEFNLLTEQNRLTRGLIDWLGFEQEYIKVKTRGRESGRPTYSTKKLASIAMDSLVSSSRTPLMIFGYVGAFITVFSVVLGLFILIQQYIMGDPLGLDWSGAVAMSVFVSFLVGLVLVSQSMTALYISQIHAEAKGRPLFIVDRRKSFDTNSLGSSERTGVSRSGVDRSGVDRSGVDKKEKL